MKNISVCMATYNGELYLRRQLESILVQIGENDEIIISDDGSSDSTKRVIDTFDDSRIKFFVNVYNKGPVGNFQHAIEKASGDYIFLADQDDIWLADKVSMTKSLLQDYDLVLSDCTVVDDKLSVLHPSYFEVRGSQPGLLRNLIKNSYMGCCLAFRREVISYCLPFPKSIHMHDWWIGLATELNGKVFFCNTPLILYVRHGKNASPTGESSYELSQKIRNRFFLIISLLKRFIFFES